MLTVENLTSGIAGAVAAAFISWAAMYVIDKQNKAWTLKVELRRHRVRRLVSANDGLRTCFFLATTQLDYHLLALRGIECTEPPLESARLDEVNRRFIEELKRYNQEIGAIEAKARAHAAFLDADFIPMPLRDNIGNTLAELTNSFTSDVASVQNRIEFFKSKTSQVMQLLTRVDSLISEEISRPLS